jgi:hypothetical protein
MIKRGSILRVYVEPDDQTLREIEGAAKESGISKGKPNGSSLFCVGKSRDQETHIYEVIPEGHVHEQLIDINHPICLTLE